MTSNVVSMLRGDNGTFAGAKALIYGAFNPALYYLSNPIKHEAF